MNTTPLWVPLVVAALGFVSTVVGIVVTQIMANRRERASWKRDTDREQQRWHREDQARTFEQRRIAYTDYFEALRDMALHAYNHGMGLTEEIFGGELSEGWQAPTWDRLATLDLYASQRVSDAAHTAYTKVWGWGNSTVHGQDDGKFYEGNEATDDAIDLLRMAIRSDLKVPDSDPDEMGNH